MAAIDPRADNPDALRGMAFSGLSFDEYGLHPPAIFSEVLSKALADHLGYAIFAGTIKGKNQLYRTYEAAKEAPDWFALWQDIDQSLATEADAATLMLSQAMHDDRQLIEKALMTQAEYDQEWYLSMEAVVDRRQLMQADRIRHMPVLNDDGRLVGIVSQRDLFHSALVRALGFGTAATQKMLDSILVKEIMATEVVATTPGTRLREAARVMTEQKIGCL